LSWFGKVCLRSLSVFAYWLRSALEFAQLA
jgi:hypothetical protein